MILATGIDLEDSLPNDSYHLLQIIFELQQITSRRFACMGVIILLAQTLGPGRIMKSFLPSFVQWILQY